MRVLSPFPESYLDSLFGGRKNTHRFGSGICELKFSEVRKVALLSHLPGDAQNTKGWRTHCNHFSSFFDLSIRCVKTMAWIGSFSRNRCRNAWACVPTEPIRRLGLMSLVRRAPKQLKAIFILKTWGLLGSYVLQGDFKSYRFRTWASLMNLWKTACAVSWALPVLAVHFRRQTPGKGIQYPIMQDCCHTTFPSTLPQLVLGLTLVPRKLQSWQHCVV